ncbi:MAG: HNH endonuclease [Candidatus Electrothrix sp. AR5]|nr:HNH endonuclease [Candidatus Electrothrix sp. AR5]
MIRLDQPAYSFEETLDNCIAGITGNVGLRNKITSSKGDFVKRETQYLAAAGTGGLHLIPPINTDKIPNPLVINTLLRSELVKIYDQYFVPETKPARRIYDSLLNAAEETCPFCGGIGTPRNLDHFLPKTHFPQFSVLPLNLVPSCRDCNMDGKGHSFATSAEDQIIHPYADNDRFFSTQWIVATYHEGNSKKPSRFEYYVSPPEDWSNVDKQRVNKHFEDFELARRYATKAAEMLGTILHQIKLMKQKGLTRDVIQSVLLQPGIDKAPFANHWQKGMYQALLQELE